MSHPPTYSTTTYSGGSKTPFRQRIKLAKATLIFVPEALGYEGIAARRIPKMPEEYICAPIAGPALVAETDLNRLVESRIASYRQNPNAPSSEGNSQLASGLRTKEFAGKVEKIASNLVFYLTQLEIHCFTDPSQIILSPRLHELLLEAREIHRQVSHNKQMIEEALLRFGRTSHLGHNLRNDEFKNEILNSRLETLFQQCEQVLNQFLHLRFEIQLTVLLGRRTNDTRIFTPFINFNGDPIENWSLARTQPIEPFHLNEDEKNDLLILYDEQIRRILVGVYTNIFSDGS